MSLLNNIIVHSFIFAIILTAYLLFMMIKFNPRIWGFSDYPKFITDRQFYSNLVQHFIKKFGPKPFVPRRTGR